jgi:hypothetical protein
MKDAQPNFRFGLRRERCSLHAEYANAELGEFSRELRIGLVLICKMSKSRTSYRCSSPFAGTLKAAQGLQQRSPQLGRPLGGEHPRR